MKRTTAKELAIDIFHWCKKNKLWDEHVIYFDDVAWVKIRQWDGIQGRHIGNDLYEYANQDVRDYVRNVREPHIISMHLDVRLRNILGGYTIVRRHNYKQEFQMLFRRYGLDYNFVEAWNITAHPLVQEDNEDIFEDADFL